MGPGREPYSSAIDRTIVDAAEGHHGRAGALGAEDGKGLGVATVAERRDGQQLGRRHDPLAAAAVKANLVHTHTIAHPSVPGIRTGRLGWYTAHFTAPDLADPAATSAAVRALLAQRLPLFGRTERDLRAPGA